MKIFKIFTIATVANGFKLIEDSDYFKDELTTTTPTTTTDTTTTDTTTNYTTTTATTTTEFFIGKMTPTETETTLEYFLRNAPKFNRWQEKPQKYEKYVWWVLRDFAYEQLGQLRLNYCDLKARDSIIELPGLKLRSMIWDIHDYALRMMARHNCILNYEY